MRWRCRHDFSLFPLLCGVLAVAAVSCAYPKGEQDGAALRGTHTELSAAREKPAPEAGAEQGVSVNRDLLRSSLEHLIEAERSGSYTQGMGVRESILREGLGDLAGAVAAAYKELAWAYGMGQIDKAAMEQGIQKGIALSGIPSQAAEGCLAFVQGRWADAGAVLREFDSSGEIDSIIRWMLLCCTLEQNREDRQASDAYRAIRSRYAQFPEYWYRGARVFAGAFSAEYAEYCLALAPAGPFAGECRTLLAAAAGLSSKDGMFLLSRPEIDEIVSRALNQGDPLMLDQLKPLISLPDNSYTIYALNVLRSLAVVPVFRDYFLDTSNQSTGRLAERLAYISRAGL